MSGEQLEQRQIKCVDDLYLEPKFVDVWFSFDLDDGTTTRIPAHKLLLAVVSDVFEKMFFGGLQESGDIAITDASVGEFKEFLQFFYRTDAKLTTEHVAGVMNLGHKYNVGKCVDACAEHLKQNLTDDSVCMALSLAILYDQNELTAICEKHILVNTGAALQSTEFLECSKDALSFILHMDQLSCSEVDVFEACMKWVQTRSQQDVVSKAAVQKYLGELYYEIRYPSMTFYEFCALEKRYTEVLRDDFYAITHLIAQTEKHHELFNLSLRHRGFPKEIKWNAEAIIECDRNSSDSYGSLKCTLSEVEKTTFSTNQPLLLGSFECNRIRFDEILFQNFKAGFPAKVQITEAHTLNDSNAKVLLNLLASLGSRVGTVSFPQPIPIRPNHFYTISVKRYSLPEGHFYASSNQQNSKFLEFGIDVKFHSDKIEQGKSGELIRKLKFNKI